MPTLPAAGYAYQPFPSTAPSTAAPQGYQRIQSSTADFGALEGAALGQLGTTLERAGDKAADQVVAQWNLYNATAAQEASNSFDKASTVLMFGDPNKPGDGGFLGLQGRAAMDAWPTVSRQIQQLKDDQRKVLFNDPQRLRFDADVNDKLNRNLRQMSSHFNSEMKNWGAQTAKGTAELAAQRAESSAASGDIPRWYADVETGSAAIKSAMELQGLPPERVLAAVTEYKKNSAATLAQNMATKDPEKARDFIERNAELLGDKKAPLLDHVRVRADELAGERLENATRGRQRTGDPAVVTGIAARLKARGWTDEAIEGALNNGQQESGFNVNATGAAGEKGLWQFHPKSHQAAFNADYKSWSWENQTDYMANIVEQSMPNYKNSTNGKQATGEFLRGFEKPKDQSDAEVDRRASNALNPKTFGTTKPPVSLREQREAIRNSNETPEVKDRAERRAEQKTQADRTDDSYQRQLKVQADKESDDALEHSFDQRIGRDPTVTAQSITDAPWHNPDARRRQLAFFEARTKMDPDPNTSNTNSIELFRRITLPADDPQAIRTRELLDKAYIDKTITRQSYDKLAEDLKKEVVGGSGAEINKSIAGAIAGAKPFIRPHAANKAMEDWADKEAQGREALYARWVQERVQAQIDSGKDWRILFRPTINGNPNPDYVRSPEALSEFKAPAPQVRNGAKDVKGTSPAVIDLTTRAGIVAAHKAGHITREAAAAKLKEIGVNFSEPLAPPIAR